MEIAEHEGFAVGQLEASDTDDFRVLLADRVRTALLALQRRGSGRAVLRALPVLKTFSLQLPDGSKVAVDVDPLLGHGATRTSCRNGATTSGTMGPARRSPPHTSTALPGPSSARWTATSSEFASTG